MSPDGDPFCSTNRRVSMGACHMLGNESREFWGSRVVPIPKGSAENIEFPLKGISQVDYEESVEVNALKISEDKVCMLGDSRIEKTVVSVDDVGRQNALIIGTDKLYYAGAYFAPMCKFKEAQQDEVDYGYSFPFFLLAKNAENVTLKFGIGGITSQEMVFVSRNDALQGAWLGTEPEESSPIKTPLNVDKEHNRRTIEITFKKDNYPKETFQWGNTISYLAINVDWEQEGMT
nr:diagnostic antigen gp50 [Hymenolepis microstoma]